MPNLQMRNILWLNSPMKILEFINTELESETQISKDRSVFKAHILSQDQDHRILKNKISSPESLRVL